MYRLRRRGDHAIARRLFGFVFLFLTSLLVGCVIHNPVAPPGPRTPVVEPALVAAATEAVKAENATLVTGDAVLKNTIVASSLHPAIDARLAEAAGRHARLAAHHIRYVDFETEIKIKSIDAEATTVTLVATEHTILKLDTTYGAPPNTETYQDRRFTFNRSGDAWLLSKVEVFDAPTLAVPDPGATPVPSGIEPLHLDDATPSEVPHPKTPPSIQSTLNHQAVVNYANAYWDHYNTAYRSFGNDCTNFVSQGMAAGGWIQVSGFYTRTDVWWYNSLNQTRTWTASHYFWWFTHDRPRGYLSSWQYLQPGDVVQADWERDGYVDHSMVVTYRDSYGNVYLTYHTNNTHNKPAWDLPSNGGYYCWRMILND